MTGPYRITFDDRVEDAVVFIDGEFPNWIGDEVFVEPPIEGSTSSDPRHEKRLTPARRFRKPRRSLHQKPDANPDPKRGTSAVESCCHATTGLHRSAPACRSEPQGPRTRVQSRSWFQSVRKGSPRSRKHPHRRPRRQSRRPRSSRPIAALKRTPRFLHAPRRTRESPAQSALLAASTSPHLVAPRGPLPQEGARPGQTRQCEFSRPVGRRSADTVAARKRIEWMTWGSEVL